MSRYTLKTYQTINIDTDDDAGTTKAKGHLGPPRPIVGDKI